MPVAATDRVTGDPHGTVVPIGWVTMTGRTQVAETVITAVRLLWLEQTSWTYTQ